MTWILLVLGACRQCTRRSAACASQDTSLSEEGIVYGESRAVVLVGAAFDKFYKQLDVGRSIVIIHGPPCRYRNTAVKLLETKCSARHSLLAFILIRSWVPRGGDVPDMDSGSVPRDIEGGTCRMASVKSAMLTRWCWTDALWCVSALRPAHHRHYLRRISACISPSLVPLTAWYSLVL